MKLLGAFAGHLGSISSNSIGILSLFSAIRQFFTRCYRLGMSQYMGISLFFSYPSVFHSMLPSWYVSIYGYIFNLQQSVSFSLDVTDVVCLNIWIYL